ncbi:MAG: heavy metal-associated domain-containing protein [Bacteroidales bacterium]|nr:heavy metal-associated domain-containing protein [Bacteroidales bacterium]
MDLSKIAISFLNILNEMSPYILLGFFIAGLLHVFVRPSAMSRHLSGGGWKPVVKAALFGIPLPLCSCGVLPTAVALRRRGASKAAATSFLIATPQTGVDSIAATWSLLGLPFAIIRPIAALAGAVGGGLAVGKFDTDEKVEISDEADEAMPESFLGRLGAAVRYGFIDMVASVGKWLVIGLVVAALITVFVPDSLFTGLSNHPLLAMLAVVVVAIPMYICATGSIPIALSLMLKGLSPGIAFVMLMAGPAANFASIMILNRTMGRRATALYVGSVVATAIGFGLVIDLLLPREWFVPAGALTEHCHVTFDWFATLCSALLTGLLIYSAFKSGKHEHNHKIINDMTHTYTIKGMNCPHCRASVEKAIAGVEGVEEVSVSLADGNATVSGTATADAIAEAVRLAGFECEA